MSTRLKDTEKFCAKLIPVTSPSVFRKLGETVTFDEKGILSYEIFGTNENERRVRHSFINLKNVQVLHPILYDKLKINSKLKNILYNKGSYIIKGGELIADPNGDTGISFFKSIVGRYKPESAAIQKVFDIIKVSPFAFLNKIIVIPPAFRETGKELVYRTVTDLNKAYTSLIRAANAIAASGDADAYSAEIQRLMENLYIAIKAQIGSKDGISRSNIQGKRLDFSGRAVITMDLSLKIDECILPLVIALKMFEPFIIAEFKKQPGRKPGDYLIYDMLQDVYDNLDASDYYEEVKKVIDSIAATRLVLLNRAPSLHKLSLLAFKPRITLDKVIKLNPFILDGYNADFDGDQMGVYSPLTRQGQEEAKKLLPSNNLFNVASRKISTQLSENFALYLYYSTAWESTSAPASKLDTNKKNLDFFRRVTLKGETATVGRWLLTLAIREAVLDDKYPIIKQPINKSIFSQMLSDIFMKYGKNALIGVLYKVRDLTMEYGSLLPDVLPEIKLSDTAKKELLPKIEELKHTPDVWDDIVSIVKRDIRNHQKNLYILLESKTTKLDWNKITQALVAKGYTQTLSGENKLMTSSQLDGLTQEELLVDTSNARRGIVDRALMTGKPGYLTRKLIFALGSTLLHPTLKDCGTSRTLKLRVNKNHVNSLVGRYALLNGKLVLLEKADAEKLVGSTINVRSPAYCKSKQICHTCYGMLSKYVNSKNIGIIASQAIGELGTQMIMRTFHVDTLVTTAKKTLPTIKEFKLTDAGYVAMQPVVIHLKKDDIEERSDFSIVTKAITVNDARYDFVFTVSLLAVEDSRETATTLELAFPKGAIPLFGGSTGHLRDKISEVDGLFELSQKLKIRDATALLERLFDEYYTLGKLDHVHFELFIGAMMRSKAKPEIPFRLSTDTAYQLVPISKVALYESPQLAFIFQRQSDAIIAGLYQDTLEEDPEERTKSDLEEYYY